MSNLIDLTFPIRKAMQTFNSHWHSVVEITQLGRHGIENRETRKITMGTHTGTHIDAPRHFIPNGKTVDQIPLTQLNGKASVVDLTDLPEHYELDLNEFKKRIAGMDCQRLILRFDWHHRFGSNAFYVDHAFLSEAVCEWLVSQKCLLLALDTPQPDNPKHGFGCKKDAPNHKILLESNIVLVEYLNNTDKLLSKTVNLTVAPLLVEEGDGAPARCWATEIK